MKRFVFAGAFWTLFFIAGEPPALAACAPVEQDPVDAAKIAFVGKALAGSRVGEVLESPARFRVLEYLKGSGPDVVRVSTCCEQQGRLASIMSEGIDPKAGQVWAIFSWEESTGGVIGTSVCDGSERLRRWEWRALIEEAGSPRFQDPMPRVGGASPVLFVVAAVAAVGMLGTGWLLLRGRSNH